MFCHPGHRRQINGKMEERDEHSPWLGTLVSLIAGIPILAVSRLLNYIEAICLIVIGLLGLFGAANFHL
jgi:hypothetical protein